MKIFIILFYCITALEAREFWANDPDFDNHGSRLQRRRFGQESKAGYGNLTSSNIPNCPGFVCDTLAGIVIKAVQAAALPCDQQDMADLIIDFALNTTEISDVSRKKMIDIAIHYRKAEKNTRPLYNTTPETGRNSLYCQRDPRHKVLLGLVQAQDPANDPQLFVDASVKPPESPSSTVRLGSRRDTFPLRNLPPEFSFLGTGDIFSNFGGSVSPGNINTSDNGNKSSSGNIGKGHCKRKKGKKTASLTSTIIATTTSNTEQNITDFPEKTVSSNVNKTETGPEYGGSNTGMNTNNGGSSTGMYTNNGGSNTGMNTNNGGSSTGMSTNNGGSSTGMNTNNGGIKNGMNTNNGGSSTGMNTNNGGSNTGMNTNNGEINNGMNTNNGGSSTGMNTNNGGSNTGMNTNNGGMNNGGVQGGVTSGNGSNPFSIPNPETLGNKKCSDLTIEFGIGFKGKEKDIAYEPFDPSHFHSAALNMAIIADFLCDEIVNKCEVKNTEQIYLDCKAFVKAMGPIKNNADKADSWNKLVGHTTSYASKPASGPGTGGNRNGT